MDTSAQQNPEATTNFPTETFPADTPPVESTPQVFTSDTTVINNNSPKPKGKKGIIIATIFSLVIILIGISAGLVLVRQRQIVEQKAINFGTCNCNGCGTVYCTGSGNNTPGTYTTRHSSCFTAQWCGGGNTNTGGGGNTNTGGGNTNTGGGNTNTGGGNTNTGGRICDSDPNCGGCSIVAMNWSCTDTTLKGEWCQNHQYSCYTNAAGRDECSNDPALCGTQNNNNNTGTNCAVQYSGVTGCASLAAGCGTVTLNKYERNAATGSNDGSCVGTSNAAGTITISGGQTICPKNLAGCGKCVQIDNANGGAAQYTGECATAPPATTAPPAITASCINFKAYNTSWVQLSANQLTTLKAGDKVRFAVSGSTTSGTFTKARFIINNVQTPETIVKKPNTQEFYYEYTIPANTKTFRVSGQVYHSTLNAWF